MIKMLESYMKEFVWSKFAVFQALILLKMELLHM